MYTVSRCVVQNQSLTLLGAGLTSRVSVAVNDDPAGLIRTFIMGNSQLLANSFSEGTVIDGEISKEHRRWEAPFGTYPNKGIIVGGFGRTHGARHTNLSGANVPAWFFKGTEAHLLFNGEPIRGVGRAVQICEEAEIILVYIINEWGAAEYAGFMFGNDVTDIITARSQPAQLGRAKLYPTPVHPELFLGAPPAQIIGRVSRFHEGKLTGEFDFETGMAELAWPAEELIKGFLSDAPVAVPGTIHMIFMGCPMNSYDQDMPFALGDQVVIEFPEYDVRMSNILHI